MKRARSLPEELREAPRQSKRSRQGRGSSSKSSVVLSDATSLRKNKHDKLPPCYNGSNNKRCLSQGTSSPFFPTVESAAVAVTTTVSSDEECPGRQKEQLQHLRYQAPTPTKLSSGRVLETPIVGMNSTSLARLEKQAWLPFLDTASLVLFSQTSKEHRKLCRLHCAWKKVEFRRKYGKFPMLAAARLGDYKFVRSILKIDQEFVLDRDKHGRNALIWAAKKNQHKMIRTLLRWTALDILETDTDGNTPIHWACTIGSLEALCCLVDPAENQMTGRAPMDRAMLVLQNSDGSTPLHLAAAGGFLECVKFLLRELKTKYQIPHLFPEWRAGTRIFYNVSLVDVRNNNGDTPLMRAAQLNHLPVVQFLLGMGATTSARNLQGQTPVYWAGLKHYWNIVTMLSEHA